MLHHRLPNRVLPSVAVVAFPYSGAPNDCYAPWAAWLGPDIDLVIRQLPRACRSADELDAHLGACAHEIAQLPHAKVVLFGHSVGALLAYATACRLAEQGRAPAHLFVSGMPAPPEHEPLTALAMLDDATFLRAVRGAGLLTKLPRRPASLARIVELLRADMRLLAWCSLPTSPQLDTRITAYGGSVDPIVPLATLQGWQRHTKHALRCVRFEGNHMWLLSDPGPLVNDIVHSLAVDASVR